MKPDPPVPRSGKCAVCGKPRPPVAVLNVDPFCSSTCARTHHGCELPVIPKHQPKKPPMWQTDAHRKRRQLLREQAAA